MLISKIVTAQKQYNKIDFVALYS